MISYYKLGCFVSERNLYGADWGELKRNKQISKQDILGKWLNLKNLQNLNI